MSIFGKKSDENNKKDDFDLDLPKFPEYSNSSKIDDQVAPIPPLEKPSASLGNNWEVKPNPVPMKFGNGVAHERPLYVKIEKYNEAMHAVEKIRNYIRMADDTLVKLERIKSKEDQELSSWYGDIRKLKDRLMEIDGILFETGK